MNSTYLMGRCLVLLGGDGGGDDGGGEETRKQGLRLLEAAATASRRVLGEIDPYFDPI
jgi:hypothetical protein